VPPSSAYSAGPAHKRPALFAGEVGDPIVTHCHAVDPVGSELRNKKDPEKTPRIAGLLMARPGLEPGTPRFSVSVEGLTAQAALAGIPRSVRMGQIPVVSGCFGRIWVTKPGP
jgi:hypothetical protein